MRGNFCATSILFQSYGASFRAVGFFACGLDSLSRRLPAGTASFAIVLARISDLEFLSCTTNKSNLILAFFECVLVSFFSLPSPVSLLRHSRISAPGFIQLGGRFGWRRFQFLRLRPVLTAALVSFLTRSFS